MTNNRTSTGVKDANGRMIYQGDFLQAGPNYPIVMVTGYNYDHEVWEAHGPLDQEEGSRLTIVGNNLDNPEIEVTDPDEWSQGVKSAVLNSERVWSSALQSR